jgi:hypothetical protein
MFLAKLSPGMFNAPYVASAVEVPVSGMNFEVARSDEKCWHYDLESYEPIGTGKYLFIAYCPALSSTLYFSTYTRLSGYCLIQFDSLPSFKIPLWPLVIPNGSTAADGGGYTMRNFYGSDGTQFSNGGFVWAGEVNTALAIPAATVAGIVYEGSLQVRQWFDPTGYPVAISGS